jgi:pimeloyl-ACP methyl ester carboxylesterase
MLIFSIKKPLLLFALILSFDINLYAQGKTMDDYSLKNLQSYPYKTSSIVIQKLVFKDNLQHAFNVYYNSMDLTISARLSIPVIKPEDIKGIVIMLRGHQYPGGYYTGKGTENPAKGYLQRGWATIAPDFLGYGSSSPTPEPVEMHQFFSTINAVELYKSLETPVFNFDSTVPQAQRINLPSSFKKIVLWSHSNGGQVALHFLEIIQKPVSTVLWAPVSLAFPDSAAHYARNPRLAERFRAEHTAADFSLFAYMDRIAPGTRILLEQGDRDFGVPKEWSDALARAIREENVRRAQTGKGIIELRYEVYKGANHNLNPYWGTVLPRDAAFWEN